MSALARTNRTLRAAGLLLVGALAVHWLRYWLAYGAHAPDELHSQGHGYLVELLPPLIALAAASLAGAAVIRLLGRFRDTRSGSQASPVVGYALALFAVFAAQELSEGLLSPSHPAGLDALFAGGGWWALPLSLAFGWALASFERILIRAEIGLLGLLAVRVSRRRPALASASLPRRVDLRRSGPLEFGLARRPPPLPTSS